MTKSKPRLYIVVVHPSASVRCAGSRAKCDAYVQANKNGNRLLVIKV